MFKCASCNKEDLNTHGWFNCHSWDLCSMLIKNISFFVKKEMYKMDWYEKGNLQGSEHW